jgi:hypothetical protein
LEFREDYEPLATRPSLVPPLTLAAEISAQIGGSRR